MAKVQSAQPMGRAEFRRQADRIVCRFTLLLCLALLLVLTGSQANASTTRQRVNRALLSHVRALIPLSITSQPAEHQANEQWRPWQYRSSSSLKAPFLKAVPLSVQHVGTGSTSLSVPPGRPQRVLPQALHSSAKLAVVVAQDSPRSHAESTASTPSLRLLQAAPSLAGSPSAYPPGIFPLLPPPLAAAPGAVPPLPPPDASPSPSLSSQPAPSPSPSPSSAPIFSPSPAPSPSPLSFPIDAPSLPPGLPPLSIAPTPPSTLPPGYAPSPATTYPACPFTGQLPRAVGSQSPALFPRCPGAAQASCCSECADVALAIKLVTMTAASFVTGNGSSGPAAAPSALAPAAAPSATSPASAPAVPPPASAPAGLPPASAPAVPPPASAPAGLPPASAPAGPPSASAPAGLPPASAPTALPPASSPAPAAAPASPPAGADSSTVSALHGMQARGHERCMSSLSSPRCLRWSVNPEFRKCKVTDPIIKCW